MKLTVQDVDHIAGLARLTIAPGEREQYVSEMSAILSYAQQLQTLDTSVVEPTTHLTEKLAELREDAVNSVTNEERAQLVAAFPKSHAGLLVVPQVFQDYKE